MALATATSMTLFDTGDALLGFQHQDNAFADPFDNSNLHHILETSMDDDRKLSQKALINRMQTQYFDCLEDAKTEDNSFIPISVLDHRVNNVTVCHISQDVNPTIKLTDERQIRVQMVWASREVSWTNASALKL